MLDRHRLLVVRQRVGRNRAHHPQRPVQPDHHRRQRLIAQRHHHPKPRPGQPRAEQHRSAAGNLRPVAVIPLQPQSRLRDPRPRAPPMLLPPATFRLRDRPPRRPIRPLIPHRHQNPVRLIRPNLRTRAIDQLIDLPRERVHQRPTTRPLRQPTTRRVPSSDQPRDRLVITPRQRRRSTQRARQVIRLKDLHRFLAFLHIRRPQIALTTTRARLPAPQDRNVGRNRGHPWGETVATSGAFRWPPTGSFPWPPSAPGRVRERSVQMDRAEHGPASLISADPSA